MLIDAGPADPAIEEELRRLQYTPEERARLFHGAAPFRLADWQQEATPATLAELAEMEGLLRQRDAEREASLNLKSRVPDDLRDWTNAYAE
jgi:hypothetical protein